jgi:hypothetical protein
MSKPIHTAGPVEVGQDGELYSYSKHQSVAMVLLSEEGEANARLLVASYNAFDSAAKKLGLNAVELAEAMQSGQLTDLLRALQWYQKNLTDHLDAPAFNALMKIGICLSPDDSVQEKEGAS